MPSGTPSASPIRHDRQDLSVSVSREFPFSSKRCGLRRGDDVEIKSSNPTLEDIIPPEMIAASGAFPRAKTYPIPIDAKESGALSRPALNS
jgi:hypothetical protein